MQDLPQKLVQGIFDAHLTTLHETMQGQVTDIEAFNQWASKVAAQCTSTTLAFMFPLTNEQTDGNYIQQDWEDHESDTQPAN